MSKMYGGSRFGYKPVHGTRDYLGDTDGVKKLPKGTRYTMRQMQAPDGLDPLPFYELRILILAAIEQARQDVIMGVTDSSVHQGRRASERADALLFFIDGRYDLLIDFCGVGTDELPLGIASWIKAVGGWARNMPGCSPVSTDIEAVMWASNEGLLAKEENWKDAAKSAKSLKKVARRLRITHLGNGRDNSIRRGGSE